MSFSRVLHGQVQVHSEPFQESVSCALFRNAKGELAGHTGQAGRQVCPEWSGGGREGT